MIALFLLALFSCIFQIAAFSYRNLDNPYPSNLPSTRQHERFSIYSHSVIIVLSELPHVDFTAFYALYFSYFIRFRTLHKLCVSFLYHIVPLKHSPNLFPSNRVFRSCTVSIRVECILAKCKEEYGRGGHCPRTMMIHLISNENEGHVRQEKNRSLPDRETERQH